ncbi:uncharacterized protein LOC141677858 isoform X2 [Apium graveolens]|uniref:uncharacterized protein LOC141677858 isoform X2 n=1 Tax=Apium graveolens TaxID=4045 RepID=UPI003D7ADB4B
MSRCEAVSINLQLIKLGSTYIGTNARRFGFTTLFTTTCYYLRTQFEGSELENVNIKFWDCIDGTPSSSESKNNLTSFMLLRYQIHLKIMFSQLGSAKILTLDLVTLQALSQIFYILAHLGCPFYNLKYLKIPHGYEESSMSRYVIRYLLSGSPSATIVRTLSRNDATPQMERAVSFITQCGVLEEPLPTTTVEINDYRYPYRRINFGVIDMRVPKENWGENSVLVADKVTQTEAPVSGASRDWADSCEKSNSVLWQGHEVNSEYVGMLDLIKEKYPYTFQDLPKKNEKLLTVKLNTLCSSVNAFFKTSMAEVDTEMITEYKILFTTLGSWGFNTNWLLSHVSYIENLHELNASDYRIDDAKNKLQELQTLLAEKSTNSESFQTMGISNASTAAYIGDGLP